MIDQYIRQYGKRLYGFCLTLCADGFDADDLYQETWLRVCQRIGSYDPSRPFEPWVTGICVNLYRDLLRRRKRSPVFDGFSTAEEKSSVMEAVAAESDPDYFPLREAIGRLPEKLRVAVILFYFHDLDEKRTAEALRVPPGTVKSRLHQAREKLRKELADETDIPF